MKCVLKMAELPLTAELHSHVCGAEALKRPDRRRWGSKMAAKLHIIRLYSLESTTFHMQQSALFNSSE